MKIIKLALILLVAVTCVNCASSYKTVEPEKINYITSKQINNVVFQYKYDLLDKKYRKKELKKNIKLIAVKITNNTNEDLMFGRDLVLIDLYGKPLELLANNYIYSNIKQGTVSYLLYLLLTPVNLYTYKTNSYGGQEITSTTPIGYGLGPGLAGVNIIAASSANKKFKDNLYKYNIDGRLIKSGETVYGLVGIQSNSLLSLSLALNKPLITSN